MAPRNQGAGNDDRIAHEVTDIASTSQLTRYALAGQLHRVLKSRPDLSQAKIASAAGLGKDARSAAPALSHALRDGPNVDQLMKLEEIINSLGGTTDLSSLYLRLAGDRPAAIATTRVPVNWMGTDGHHASSELEVLAEASALLSAFTAAARVDIRSIGPVGERFGHENMKLLVRRLILISASPPTPKSYDAQIILGSLASYAFDQMREWLDIAVRYFPLAFQAWRSITKLVRLTRKGAAADELQEWLQQLIGDSSRLRMTSLHPGRGLDLELALSVPKQWSPPGNDWVGEALRARACDANATIRERGTAVMGLWERALEQGTFAEIEPELRRLVIEFRDEKTRPDASAGMRWVAATLEAVMDSRVPVCNEWPETGERWQANVMRAADRLERYVIARHLRQGTRSLFLHMLLQNSGPYRRNAIETVVTSGMTNPIARALGDLLTSETSESWLRLRAEYALGCLQRANRYVEEDLTKACLTAYRRLPFDQVAEGELPRSIVTEVHAALFAIADCFGVPGVEDRATSARERLRPVLTELSDASNAHAMGLRRAARAATYFLIVTAQPRAGDEPDLAQILLAKLQDHPDEVTARLARWALSFRFAPDGKIRSLLDAADYQETFDDPFI